MADADSLNFTPERMSLANVATGQTLDVQFNPTEFDESLDVNWNRLAILGLSHMPLQYLQTGNQGFSFELALRAWDKNGNQMPNIMSARNFLLSLCYPSRTSQDIKGGAPPRVLFVWPGLVSIISVISRLKAKYTLFNKQGQPVHFSYTVDIEEIRDVRLYSEDVLAQGTQRSGQGTPNSPSGGANSGA